jgi:hypothetical protein
MVPTTQVFPRQGSVCPKCGADRARDIPHGPSCPINTLAPVRASPKVLILRLARRIAAKLPEHPEHKVAL